MGTGHRSRLLTPRFARSPRGGRAALSRAALPPLAPAAGGNPVIQNPADILYGKYVIQNMGFVWLVLPALPLFLPLLLLGLPGAPSPRARSPCPARPSPSGRLAGWGALAPCAGDPPGVFRRLRAAVSPPNTKSQGQDKRAYGAALTFVFSGEDGKQGESP